MTPTTSPNEPTTPGASPQPETKPHGQVPHHKLRHRPSNPNWAEVVTALATAAVVLVAVGAACLEAGKVQQVMKEAEADHEHIRQHYYDVMPPASPVPYQTPDYQKSEEVRYPYHAPTRPDAIVEPAVAREMKQER